MTQIALTIADSSEGVARGLMGEPRPRCLVAFPYWTDYTGLVRRGIEVRDYLLDSGAYSAYNSGRPVKLEEYIAFVLGKQDDPRCAGIFALDAIGSWEETHQNFLAMRKAGCHSVIPTFHIGEPWEALQALKDEPRIALGGLVAGANPTVQKTARGRNERLAWIERCFAMVWPKWIHGFGVKDPRILRRVPFASVDTANWFTDPYAWGTWKAFPFKGRGSSPRQAHLGSLRAEVEWWMRLERELQGLWSVALARVPGALLPSQRKAAVV